MSDSRIRFGPNGDEVAGPQPVPDRRRVPHEFIEALEDFFHNLETCSGVRICLHDYAFITSHSLPLRRYAHHSEYCRLIKLNPCREKLCRECDLERAVDEAHQSDGPFIRYCHAGVCEVLVPVKDHSGRLMAMVFCGQVFSAERERPREVDGAILEAVPVVPEETVWAVARVVDRYFRMSLSLTTALADFNRPLEFCHKSMAKAIEIIEDRFRERLSVKQVAREVGLSVSRFEHLIKLETGKSFTASLRQRRLQEAVQLLCYTDLRVTEIARRLGFEDAGYFHRIFKREKNMTPLDYREGSRRLRSV